MSDFLQRTDSGHYSDITIVAGGNDCEDSTPMNEIISTFREVIQTSKEKAKSVHVASILPRIIPGNDSVMERIDNANAQIEVMCADTGVTYYNNNTVFRLQNGLINDGYFLLERNQKQLHLNDKGSARLCSNLDIKIKDGFKCTKPRDHYRHKPQHTYQ